MLGMGAADIAYTMQRCRVDVYERIVGCETALTVGACRSRGASVTPGMATASGPRMLRSIRRWVGSRLRQ